MGPSEPWKRSGKRNDRRFDFRSLTFVVSFLGQGEGQRTSCCRNWILIVTSCTVYAPGRLSKLVSRDVLDFRLYVSSQNYCNAMLSDVKLSVSTSRFAYVTISWRQWKIGS